MPVNYENKSVVKILESAFECFGRSGYHGTSLKEIARHAGVSKALIHYHFESKETLLFELEGWLHRQVFHAITAMASDAEPGLETAMNALDEMAIQMKRLAPLTPVFLELSAAAFGHPELRERSDQFRNDTLALVEVGLVNLLGPDANHLLIPAKRLAPLLLACLQGIALAGLYSGDGSRAIALDDLKELLRRGILNDEAQLVVAGRPSSSVSIDHDDNLYTGEK